MAIIADYPGLLPASHVSNQETSPPKELPRSVSPTALSHAPKGRCSARHAAPGASSKRVAPTSGKPSNRKANKDMAEPSSKRYGFKNMRLGSHPTVAFMFILYSGKKCVGLYSGVRLVILPTARIQILP